MVFLLNAVDQPDSFAISMHLKFEALKKSHRGSPIPAEVADEPVRITIDTPLPPIIGFFAHDLLVSKSVRDFLVEVGLQGAVNFIPMNVEVNGNSIQECSYFLIDVLARRLITDWEKTETRAIGNSPTYKKSAFMAATVRPPRYHFLLEPEGRHLWRESDFEDQSRVFFGPSGIFCSEALWRDLDGLCPSNLVPINFRDASEYQKFFR
jgi:hypothetical protein